MHEVLTIQLGQFSNFVGTHFWNTQEAYFTYDDQPAPEMLHDILFRTGITPNGSESYTPRTLIFDLKGGFGSLKRMNKLYENEDLSAETWDHEVQTFAQPAYSRNNFLRHLEEEDSKSMEQQESEQEFNLDEDVTYWSDFNRVYYHPHSMNQINNFQFGDKLAPFDIYTQGKEAYIEFEKECDIFDQNFRFFTEECDCIQGLQIFTHSFDGFGGFCTAFLEEIRDEFPKIPMLTYGLMNPQPVKDDRDQQKQDLNIALQTVELTDLSSTFVPLYSPTVSTFQGGGWSKYLTTKSNLPYHTSALLSAGIECASLPWRTKTNLIPMTDLLTRLNWRNNMNISSLSLAIPFPLQENKYGNASHIPLVGAHNIMKDFSAELDIEREEIVLVQSLVLRGIPIYSDIRKSEEYSSEVFNRFEVMNRVASSSHVIQTPYPLPNSFPHFFQGLNIDGHVLSRDQPITRPRSLPLLSNLHTTNQTQHFLRRQIEAMKSSGAHVLTMFKEGVKGISADDFESAKEILMGLLENYEDN